MTIRFIPGQKYFFAETNLVISNNKNSPSPEANPEGLESVLTTDAPNQTRNVKTTDPNQEKMESVPPLVPFKELVEGTNHTKVAVIVV